jgi:Fic family protein
LKREVAGTSRIEGAEFTERELDAALAETPQQLETRSQRQAAAAVAAYRWIADLPADQPVDVNMIQGIHYRIVSNCDEDHCPPGKFRMTDANVTFGNPRHRGINGGEECLKAIKDLTAAARGVYLEHDPLIQALALHYHFAALHPFLDGNGRTARALEAVMLQRVGLRNTLFIAMSNYYYEEKANYLKALAEAQATNHDLTSFLVFGLKGIAIQCQRLLKEIQRQLTKALYRDTMHELFGRLESPRKRVMSARHIRILNFLLERESITMKEFMNEAKSFYGVKNIGKAMLRDVMYLDEMGAIYLEPPYTGSGPKITINLQWPTEITKTEFFKRAQEMPKAKLKLNPS